MVNVIILAGLAIYFTIRFFAENGSVHRKKFLWFAMSCSFQVISNLLSCYNIGDSFRAMSRYAGLMFLVLAVVEIVKIDYKFKK